MNNSYDSKISELNNIANKIFKTQIMASPGAILFGIGLYGLDPGRSSNEFYQLLTHPVVVYSCLAIGTVIMMWELSILFSLWGGERTN